MDKEKKEYMKIQVACGLSGKILAVVELDSSLSMHKRTKQFGLKLIELAQEGIIGIWKLTNDRIKGSGEIEVVLSPELLRYHFDRLDGRSHIQYFIENICPSVVLDMDMEENKQFNF